VCPAQGVGGVEETRRGFTDYIRMRTYTTGSFIGCRGMPKQRVSNQPDSCVVVSVGRGGDRPRNRQKRTYADRKQQKLEKENNIHGGRRMAIGRGTHVVLSSTGVCKITDPSPFLNSLSQRAGGCKKKRIYVS